MTRLPKRRARSLSLRFPNRRAMSESWARWGRLTVASPDRLPSIAASLQGEVEEGRANRIGVPDRPAWARLASRIAARRPTSSRPAAPTISHPKRSHRQPPALTSFLRAWLSQELDSQRPICHRHTLFRRGRRGRRRRREGTAKVVEERPMKATRPRRRIFATPLV